MIDGDQTHLYGLDVSLTTSPQTTLVSSLPTGLLNLLGWTYNNISNALANLAYGDYDITLAHPSGIGCLLGFKWVRPVGYGEVGYVLLPNLVFVSILDIVYLASGQEPGCRSRYRFDVKALVQEVPTHSTGS